MLFTLVQNVSLFSNECKQETVFIPVNVKSAETFLEWDMLINHLLNEKENSTVFLRFSSL